MDLSTQSILKRSAALCGALAVSTAAAAANWPQWRGPEFNGSTSEKGLPSQFSKTENVVWTAVLPGPSASTPVVWGDTLFVTTADKNARELRAMALDRKTGKERWSKKVIDGYSRDERSNFASPSPATDGERVVFFFGNGEMVCFGLQGEEYWRRNLQADYGDFAFQWTFSSSPVISGGKIYQQVLQRNQPVHGKGKPGAESFLLALDPQTGKTLWRHVRPSEAVAESLESFSTPMPWTYQGRKELLITGGDCVSGHDPETGKELWRWGTWNPTKIGHWRLVPSPIAGAGVILACAPKGSPIYAVKAGAHGAVPDSGLAWTSAEQRTLSSDVPTPAFYGGDFIILGDQRRSLSRVEPATGKIKWTLETPGRSKYEASPLAADGKIYIMNFASEVTVVDAEKGSILATVPMGDPGENESRASIIAAHGKLFIRTLQKIYCVGQP